ncbi:MAG: RNA polymerase subunit sigma [Pseudopedobacter saltans]|uniref:RNA polymerase subunit sigma n=1 Tax=Pseudopedobacter saltans TaxID=151895 RepID=A0A2W5HFD6_9SPHI|nr:MAG: RNA polymerase subunit sigma [Pseudopedobacter saltans]
MSKNLKFDDILVSNADFLKPFATKLTRDSDLARDLFQETMFRALANKDKYNVGTNIKAWLYTIMRNIFINNYRRKAKLHTVFDGTPNEAMINNNTTSIPNDSIAHTSMKEVKTAINDLPEIFRKPFMLYFEGYKYHEIAHVLGEPLGTIKSRIHFARKLLKKKIARF